MSRSTTELFARFDRGLISRRQLIAALAAAAVPAIALAQAPCVPRPAADTAGRGGRAGGAGGRGGAGGAGGAGRAQAPRDTTQLVMPFEPTGWKTVWLDRFTYTCTDYKKAAAFYATLMGWKVRSDNGSECLMDIGENVGGVLIRGGLKVAPPPAITDAGLGVTRPPINAVWDGFAWGIDQWDEKKVEAELKKRGLNPVADHHGDYRAFTVKDPDGFSVSITNGTKANRRKGPANGKLPAPAPFEPTGWITGYLDHISFEVPDFARSAAFYKALLGWEGRGGGGGGGQTTVLIGDNGIAGGAIIRGNAAARARGRGGDSAAQRVMPPPGSVTAAIGHISFGMDNWNGDKFREELIKRDVCYTNAQCQREPRKDYTGQLQSWHVPDAMGWDLQIGNKVGEGKYVTHD